MITPLIILIVLGVVLQLLKVKIDRTIYNLVLVLIVLMVCVLILSWFGVWSGAGLRIK